MIILLNEVNFYQFLFLKPLESIKTIFIDCGSVQKVYVLKISLIDLKYKKIPAFKTIGSSG